MKITSINNYPLRSVSETVRESSNNIRTIRIQYIIAGYTLKSGPVADVAIEGRLVGDVSWIDLETTGIDLTPYDGLTKDFEIRYSAGAVYGGDPISDANPIQIRNFDLQLAV